MVADCYDSTEQKTFLDGLENLRAVSQKLYKKEFNALKDGEKYDLIKSLEKESADYNAARQNKDVHYYTMIKQLTIWGYFSSEPGMTQALRHVRVPGRYEGCIPLEKGQKAWA